MFVDDWWLVVRELHRQPLADLRQPSFFRVVFDGRQMVVDDRRAVLVGERFSMQASTTIDNQTRLPYKMNTFDPEKCRWWRNRGRVVLSWSATGRRLVVGADLHYTDGDFWRREHHGMFLSRGLFVSGLIFFPKYHFKPQDTGNIPWCSRQQSRHLLYCMATHCPHCLARLRHSSQKFTKLSIFFSGDFL